MKRLIFIILLGTYLGNLHVIAQNCELSKEGHENLIKARTIFKYAKSPQENQKAADLFELILKTDPNCPDIYKILGLLYSELCVHNGEPAYTKAKKYLNQYLILNPEEQTMINDELISLDAKLKVYQSNLRINMLNDFEGTWECKSYYEGKFIGKILLQITKNDNGLDIMWNNHNTFIIQIDNNRITFDLKMYDYESGSTNYSNRYIGQYNRIESGFRASISLVTKNKINLIQGQPSKFQYFLHDKFIYEENWLIRDIKNTLERVY